jgi:ABC-type sugar transport system substrate-binding protein
MPFSQTAANWPLESEPMGVAAGKYVKAHPSMGPPVIAILYGVPTSSVSIGRAQGFINGVRSVLPNAKVVYPTGATDASDAVTKMTNYIDSGVHFNMFFATGGDVFTGGESAINAAGLGMTSDKQPAKVYSAGIDATPTQLANLWSVSGNTMRDATYGAKTAAEASATLLFNVLDGKTSINTPATLDVPPLILTPDCQANRSVMAVQYQGVPGFALPSCSFTFTGDNNTYSSAG